MCTFFARSVALAVLLVGCGRSAGPRPDSAAPVPRADTLRIAIPVVRLTPADSAPGSARLDSATIELLERRIMSRVASMLRVDAQIAAGNKSAGIPPVKGAAPDIRHGLLGTINFTEDGGIAETSRQRLQAVANMLDEIAEPVELRVRVDLNNTRNVDVGMARARRVYVDLLSYNRGLAERDVVISVIGEASLQPIVPVVEIYWRAR
jgi:hypothetical protein